MEFISPSAQWFNDLQLSSLDRLLITQRLKELAIPHEFSGQKNLRVRIKDATEAIQVWSVVQQTIAPRCKLLKHLENCWNSPNAS